MGQQTIITSVKAKVIKAPLYQPFRTALGQHDELENVYFGLKLADGTFGLGEAAVAPHITGETVEQTLENLNAVGAELVGRNAADYLRLSAYAHERLLDNASAVAAIEVAAADALARSLKVPLWKFFGTAPKRLVSDITIVISDLKETQNAVRKFYAQGFRAFKVKVGRDRDLDIKRVMAVRQMAPRCAIYLDANQGYSADETLGFLKALKQKGIRPALIEQPVPKDDWEGLKKVSRLCGVPVCADEGVSSMSQAARLMREKAATVINVKLMKFGLWHAREISWLARVAGVKLMIGGMMETSLAMTAAAHLAAGLGCFDFVDLDTPFFVKKDIVKNPYLNTRGVYDLKNVKAGVGISLPSEFMKT